MLFQKRDKPSRFVGSFYIFEEHSSGNDDMAKTSTKIVLTALIAVTAAAFIVRAQKVISVTNGGILDHFSFLKSIINLICNL